jgi:hypothetical protein
MELPVEPRTASTSEVEPRMSGSALDSAERGVAGPKGGGQRCWPWGRGGVGWCWRCGTGRGEHRARRGGAARGAGRRGGGDIVNHGGGSGGCGWIG